jgi:cytochrome P450
VTIQTLLQYPEYWARCAEDKAFCGKIIEEMLRYSAPTTPYRQVEEDFVYQDVRFPKGTMLVFPTFFSGRDPSVFPDPLKFDPERVHANRQAAFGRGAHICLGMHIARTQLEEGLHIITQRLKKPRLAGAIELRPFLGVWGPSSLPIAFEPAPARETCPKDEVNAAGTGAMSDRPRQSA